MTVRNFGHDDVNKWKHFPFYWPFVRGIHQTKHNINLHIYQKSYCIFMNSYSSFWKFLWRSLDKKEMQIEYWSIESVQLGCALFNSFWPSDVIWWQGSTSTLAQVMACYLTAPSHYLTNVDISVRSSGIHLRAILQEITQPSVTEISLKITYLKFHSNLPRVNELTVTHRSLDKMDIRLHCKMHFLLNENIWI